MKLQDQVCSLEQAKKLIQLGVEINPDTNDFGSAYWHVFDAGMKWRIAPEGYFDPFEDGVEHFPAFTVAELGVMLPNGYDTLRLTSIRDWWRGYNDRGHDCPLTTEDEPHGYETEAQCRAAMLIHLLTPKEEQCTQCFGHGTWQGGLNCPSCGGGGYIPVPAILTAQEVNARLTS